MMKKEEIKRVFKSFPAFVPKPIRDWFSHPSSQFLDKHTKESIMRLACDEGMKKIYEQLKKCFGDDSPNISHFVISAWAAQQKDFSKERDAVKRATELNQDIKETAKKLADLLRKIERTGVNPPFDFFWVNRLLLKTDNPRDPIWMGMKHVVTGEKENFTDGEAFRKAEFLRHAWTKAPMLSDLLDTLANVSEQYVPETADRTVCAAMASRKNTSKTQYLRTFGTFLQEEYEIQITEPIVKAMAETATIALENELDCSVSYDDVRKAIATLTNKRS